MAENVSWGKVTGFWKDLRELGKLAVPVSLSSIFSFLLPIQTMLFIGRLGPEELGAVALGNTWCNVTGASVALGTFLFQIKESSFSWLCGPESWHGCYRLWYFKCFCPVDMAIVLGTFGSWFLWSCYHVAS